MKLLFYKSLVLFLAFTGSVLGQKEVVLRETFEVGSAKVLELDLKNIPLTIVPSLDNKIHVDFTMVFKGFTKQEIKSKLNKVYFKKVISPNDVKLYIKSETTISPSHFFSTKGIVIKDTKDFFSLSNNKEEKKDKRKSKADIINEIRTGSLEDESFLSQITKQIENDKDAQVQKAHFFIRVPKKLQLKIKAQGVRLTSEIAQSKDLKIEMNGSSFKARKLLNANVSIMNASLEVEEINGGSYSLIGSSNSLIGSVGSTTFNSETSKIQIGELLQGVNLKDFNSEYFIYNLAPNFIKTNFNGDYSKLHIFGGKENYSMTAFGNNTSLKMGDVTGRVGVKKNKTQKLFEKKANKNEDNYLGHIKLNLTNGFVDIKDLSFNKNN